MTIFSRFFFHFHFLLALVLPSLSLLAQTETRVENKVENIVMEKEFSLEVPADMTSTIHFTNTSHNLQINTWSENKVRVITTATFSDEEKVPSSDDFFSEAGITLKNIAGGVELNSRTNTVFSAGNSYLNDGHVYTYTNPQDLSKTNAAKSSTSSSILLDLEPLKQSSTSKRRLLTVFIPANSKIDIDSRSSNISIEDDLPAARLTISNTSFDCANVEDMRLSAKYCIVNTGDIATAQMEMENSTLRALSIGDLDIDSKSSGIEYQDGNTINMRSQRDNYFIESVKTVQGRKLYGDLRIDDLHKLLDIEGINADIKIRNIMPEVDQVTLKDKYAELRLPLKNLKNYAVNFQGSYSTVFTPFEKEMAKQLQITEENIPLEKGTSKTKTKNIRIVDDAKWTSEVSPAASANSKTQDNADADKIPVNFKGTKGDIKGKHTKFLINCSSCTVDFK